MRSLISRKDNGIITSSAETIKSFTIEMTMSITVAQNEKETPTMLSSEKPCLNQMNGCESCINPTNAYS